MRKHLRLLLCGALLVAALFTFNAFTSAPTGMNPHTAHAAPATTMSPSYSCPLPVLQEGDSGWAVKLMQQSLNWWYNHPSTGFTAYVNHYDRGAFPIAEDGKFGAHTRNAVSLFQDWDYKATGGVDKYVGPKTWHALGHC